MDLRKAVEPDRVHRGVYTDPAIFDIEMDRLFHRVWTYVGHESQVKKPGDYWTVQVGKQPMVMVRHSDGKVHVLYNRCPHRGAMLYGNRSGNVGDAITCSYHSWQFKPTAPVRRSRSTKVTTTPAWRPARPTARCAT